MDRTYVLFGVVTGLSIVLVAFIIARVVSKKKKGSVLEFDERQLAARAQAYKWGFFTLMGANLISGFFNYFLPWAEPLVAEIICIFTGLLVFAGICIKKDAFTALNKNPRQVAISFGLLFLANAMSSATVLSSMPIVKDGLLSFPCICLTAAVSMLVVLVMWGVDRLIKRSKADEES